MPYIGFSNTDQQQFAVFSSPDINGTKLKLDADGDTSITADTDDQIDVEISGADDFRFTANNFNVLSGSTLTVDSGATITNSGTASGFVGANPTSADGDTLGTASLEWSDLYLADSSVIYFGADQDVTLTHVADTGILLNSTMAIQFNDSSQYINAPSNAILDINATDEVEVNATLMDVNANLDVSGTIVGASTLSATTITASTAVVPDASDGAALGTTSLEWSDLYIADGGIIYFGDDQEITLTHNADDGLILKHVGTGDGKEPSLTFQAGDIDIAVDDVLGSIFFQAPDEGAGTDAILVAAGIEAVSEGDFSSSSNATKLSFKTASTDTAAETMSLSSGGNLTVEGAISAGSYNDNIVLNGTDNSSSNGGDDLVLDSSAASTDVNARVLYEDATGHNFIHDEREEIVVRDKMLLEGNEGSGRILVESNWGDGVITFEDGVNDTAKILSGHGITFEDKKFRISGSAAADITALTDAAVISLDFAAAQNFSVTLAGNRTLANPTNIVAGQTGSIAVTQDGTGSRTLAYGTYWDFAGGTAPTLTTTASKVDRLDYIVITATDIHAVATLQLE